MTNYTHRKGGGGVSQEAAAPAAEPEFIGLPALARRAGLDRKTLLRMIDDGDYDPPLLFRPGRNYRMRFAAGVAWVERILSARGDR